MQDGQFHIEEPSKKKRPKVVKSFSEEVITQQPKEVTDWGEEVTTSPEKKNGTSNGLTNVEEFATTSVPSTLPLHLDGNISEGTSIIDSGEEWTMKKGKWVVTKAGDWSKKGDIADEKYAKIYSENYLNNVYGNNPVPSTSPLPVNGDPFSFDRFVPQELEKHPEYREPPIAKRITLLPKAQSIIEAKEQDKNILGNLWNSLVSGVASLGAGIADIHAIITSDDVKAQRETIAKQREAFSEQFGAYVTTEEKAAFDENLITSTAGSLVNMIPGIPGKGVGLFIMAYDNAGQSIEQSPKGKDLPESTKTIYKATVGTTVGAMDRIPILKLFFGKQTDKVAAGITTKVLTNLIKTSKVPITAEMAQAAITAELKSLKNTIIQGGKKVATGAGLESITETGQEGFTMFAEEVLNKAQGEEVFEEKSWQDNLVRLGRSAAGGALGGTALGGLSIPFNKTRDYISEKVAAAKTPEDLTALKAELMDAAESQKLSQPELDELGKTIDNYVRVNQKIPSDQTDARKEIAEKIIEREEIENEVTKKLEEVVSVDEAFKPAIREESEALRGRVEEINEEIKNLASPTDTKLSEPIEGLDEQGIPIGENVPKPTDVGTEVTDSNAPLIETRTEEDILNIIKAPLPTGKLKRMEVQVKSIDPDTNEVTLKPMKARDAIVDLKKQVGVIDMIKKCL